MSTHAVWYVERVTREHIFVDVKARVMMSTSRLLDTHVHSGEHADACTIYAACVVQRIITSQVYTRVTERLNTTY